MIDINSNNIDEVLMNFDEVSIRSLIFRLADRMSEEEFNSAVREEVEECLFLPTEDVEKDIEEIYKITEEFYNPAETDDDNIVGTLAGYIISFYQSRLDLMAALDQGDLIDALMESLEEAIPKAPVIFNGKYPDLNKEVLDIVLYTIDETYFEYDMEKAE